ATFTPIERPQTPLPVTSAAYAFDEAVDLKGPLIAAAIALMLIDTLAVLWMGGLLSRRPARARGPTATGLAVAAIAAGLILMPHGSARAQDGQEVRVSDEEAIAAITETRIAYVLTGNGSIDAVSRAGLEGLSLYLTEKTALEPGEPAGVDIETDELAFYPLIYWPIDETAPMPSEAALARVDAYMREGGTVLFDTRDQYSTGFGANATS